MLQLSNNDARQSLVISVANNLMKFFDPQGDQLCSEIADDLQLEVNSYYALLANTAG